MTERELFIDTVLFKRPEKIPMLTMGPRESTLKRWSEEGIDKDQPWFESLCRQLNISYPHPRAPRIWPGVGFKMRPIFEEKVLEHKNGHYIVQDWMGNVTEISDEYDVSYIRDGRDFVTRRWLKFPVNSPADFEDMKTRYLLDDRLPDDFDERCAALANRDYPLSISIPGPFWQLREWCGFEPLCMLLLDDPEFVQAMIDFWSDFVAGVLERSLEKLKPDAIHVSEDMAYKGASMISPDMIREFLFPSWQRWGNIARSAGVPVYDMDSDGKIDQLIPFWIEAGINLCDPIEVAAGCDILQYQRDHGERMAYSGGIDKRCMAKGGASIEEEMRRLEPAVKSGGFIPGCDHGIPSDVSWPNMLHFGKLWAELTGWL